MKLIKEKEEEEEEEEEKEEEQKEEREKIYIMLGKRNGYSIKEKRR